MKKNISNIINVLATNILSADKAITLEAAQFENVLRGFGIGVKYDKAGNLNVTCSKAQAKALIDGVNAQFDKVHGEERIGCRKTLDNRFCSLRASYGIELRAKIEHKSKYSKAEIAKTVKWVKVAFKKTDEELAGFFNACYKAVKAAK